MTGIPDSIAEAGANLRDGSLASLDLTEAVFSRADVLDGAIGSFLVRFDDSARIAAKNADKEIASGIDRGPLHGIPLGIKDLLASTEGVTTCQSRVHSRFAPPDVDSEAVARLRRAGAVIVGKTTLSEHAFGSPDADAGFPVPRNPWDPERWPGGSSSGTASGLAAGFFLGGIGTDTGGSIRIPAALCGVTGLKPTLGLVPTAGCAQYSWSHDTIGPMGRSARDCAALLAAMRDRPANHLGTVGGADRLPTELTGLRIGVERRHTGLAGGSDPAVLQSVEEAVSLLLEAGASVEEVSIEPWDVAAAAALVISRSEAFAVHRADLSRRWGDYGLATRTQLAEGVVVSGPDYVQATRVRALWRANLARVLAVVDAIVTPTVGVTAPRLDGDIKGLMPLFFTGVWNLAGNPALSMPVAPVGDLPVGLQVIGRPFDEETVLRVADAYQQRTAWHRYEVPLP